MDTLQACLAEVNTHGATGALTWSDGFAVSLGTVVHLAIIGPVTDGVFFLVYAVQGFEEGGTHHAGYHVHRIVNWATEDPPLLLAVIDEQGRTLEFTVIEPSVEPDVASAYAEWRRRLDANPACKAEAFARVQAALEHVARGWSEEW